MEKLFRRILFFVFGIVYGPLMLFSNLTYAWWQGLNKDKNNITKRFLFYILAPIYGPMTFFLYLTYSWWAGLYK